MSAGTYNITIDQGSDFSLQLTVKEAGVAKDLTGYSARAQIRKKASSVSPAASFVCNVVSPETNGTISMSLGNAVSSDMEPGLYVYDLEIYTANDDTVTRLLSGSVKISPEITK